MTTLNLLAKQDFLEREAGGRDPIKAISELVWNGLDADATEIQVDFERSALGGIIAINVIDNGIGISPDRAAHDFANLGDSWKRQSHRTASGRAIHGKEGRGRLRFFPLAQRAQWHTTYSGVDGLASQRIEIHSRSLERCEVEALAEATADKTGTIVELTALKETFDWLITPEAFRQFSTVFAPYILQYPDTKIWWNGFDVDPEVTIDRWKELPICFQSSMMGDGRNRLAID